MTKWFIAILLIVLTAHVVGIFHKYDKPEPKEEQRDKPSSSIRVKIADKPSEEGDSKEEGVSRMLKAESKCKTWFYGFGITHDFASDEVSEVKPGYPAYRAGVLTGDILVYILNDQGENEKYTAPSPSESKYEGRVATLVVVRGGVTLRFRLHREKICTEER